MRENKIILKVVFVTFLLILSCTCTLVNVSALKPEESKDHEAEEESVNLRLENLLNRKLPLTIDQYEEGRLVKTFYRGITLLEHLQIYSKMSEKDESENILDVLIDSKIFSEDEMEFLCNMKERYADLHKANSDNFNGEFSFTEEDSNIYIGRVGIIPAWFLCTGLSMIITEGIINLIDLILLKINNTEYLLWLYQNSKLFRFLLDCFGLFLFSSVLLINFMNRFFFRPFFSRNIHWWGWSALTVTISTKNYNYVGMGYVHADLTHFTGVHIKNTYFIQYLLGHADKIIAKGRLS